MVFFKLPRVFILAGFVIILLVLSTKSHLYKDEGTYYASSSGRQSGSKGEDWDHAMRPEAPVVVLEASNTEGGSGSNAVSPVIGSSAPAAEPESGAAKASAAAPAVEPPASHIAPTAKPTAIHAPGKPLQIGNHEDDYPNPILPPGQCPDLDFLKRVHSQQKLSDTVRYKKVCVQPVFSADVDRNTIDSVSTSLFGDEVTIDIDKCDEARLPRCTPIKLHVPRPYAEYNVSHLIFGISTTFKRLDDEVGAFAHWLSRPAGDGAKMIALVTDYSSKSGDEIERLQKKFQTAKMNVDVVKPIKDSWTTSQSHFSVLEHMLNSSSSDTQWYGLLDDDTFFPRGLKPLSDALAKLDHNQDYYVGALSEDFRAVSTFGFMAFGGAGAYLSAPLAKVLGSQLRKCIKEAGQTEGDIIIRHCVYKNSRAKLTLLPGLFQQDLKDDASGFFESGVQAINFHHWKSWYEEPVVRMAAAALYCGDCFLQRWRFGADTIFTNGYSVVKYLYDVDYLDLNQMEGTWSNTNGGDFDFSIGPLRRKLESDEKKSYKLKDIEWSDHGDFRQLYVWKGNPRTKESDGVIEFVWQK